jgi:hypothetical protein
MRTALLARSNVLAFITNFRQVINNYPSAKSTWISPEMAGSYYGSLGFYYSLGLRRIFG